MKTKFLSLLILCFIGANVWAQATKNTAAIADARKRLTQIYEKDQKERSAYDAIERQYGWGAKEAQDARQKIKDMDKEHLVEVEKIISQVGGYPGKSVVGQPLDQVAFLIIQHSTDRAIHEKYLPMVTEAAQKGELDKAGVAFLTDQVKVQKKEKQVYGTQIHINNKGQKDVYPIEDEANVDQRRKQMELEPMSAYLARMGVKK
ncbi:DUF6624 domain-containing protein [Larkinella rosea]|uniref:Uncharacterized protein n=1 Tax=Larkinella rosea TaxID=2025312 RepID=A0A3P1BM12_9BACT|nr:DUF6624 domain-containing protein [Larkinella rosea]RRB02069.1 hypothetical protein EHT25_16390 [Larkinella rosea]